MHTPDTRDGQLHTRAGALGRRRFLGLAAAGTAAVAAGAPTAARTAPRDHRAGQLTAFTGAAVVDPDAGTTRHNQTVLICGERILAVGSRLPVPSDARVIDLTGKYVIPGLMDMHVHSLGSERIAPPLFLANGVTTVREMAGNPDLYDWRDRVEAGTLFGPRMSVAGRIIDGDPTLWPPDLVEVFVVDTERAARRAVREVKADGADFVKVYSRLSSDVHAAIVDEARCLGLTVAGHAPDAIPVDRTSARGQTSIEHVHSLGLAVSARQRRIRRMLADMSIETGDYNGWFRQLHPIEWAARNTFSHEHARRVFGELARNRTRAVPTLTMHRVLDLPDGVDPNDDRLRYLPKSELEVWNWTLENFYRANRTPQEIARGREMVEYRRRVVGELRRSGVPLMTGTDTGTPYCFMGFGLHDELEELVRAGLGSYEALRAATSEPARFLGREHELGHIRPFGVADLVVLDENPVADIRNTRQIDSIVVRGRLVSARQRRRMLAEVERAAQEEPVAARRVRCCG